jgi:hypothetical protein
LFDSFKIFDQQIVRSPTYYLPEEPLDVLKDTDAYGEWKLEMWDSRTGATNLVALDSWQLRFTFENIIPVPINLVHGVTRSNTVPPGEIAYFTVDVPAWARFATNILTYASAPVNLLFNQYLPPTGTNVGDFKLLNNSVGGIGNPVLNLGSTPPLIPGARYYLGVQNPNSSSVVAALQVDFDITPLTNRVPYDATMPASVLPRYFSYDVSSQGTAVSFQLLNLSGNLDLVARKGAPLPTLNDFDYGSFNPGNDDEEIIVFTNSSPMPLSAGRWYLGVFNIDLGTNDYTILATEYTNSFPPIITLTNAIAYNATNSAGSPTNDYYLFIVSASAVGARFEIDHPTADMTLVARKGLPLPTLSFYDLISANPGTNDEVIVFYATSTPVPLTPGYWFLDAVSVSSLPVSYSIMATELSENPINITSYELTSNGFCLTWTSLPGNQYFVQGSPALPATNWTVVSPQLTATNYQTTYCIPMPSPLHFFRVGAGPIPLPSP